MNWQKCVRCNVYFDQPNYLATAELCPDCWKYLPHYRLNPDGAIKTQGKKTGIELPHILKDITFPELLMYVVGNGICLLIVIFYLWFK